MTGWPDTYTKLTRKGGLLANCICLPFFMNENRRVGRVPVVSCFYGSEEELWWYEVKGERLVTDVRGHSFFALAATCYNLLAS